MMLKYSSCFLCTVLNYFVHLVINFLSCFLWINIMAICLNRCIVWVLFIHTIWNDYTSGYLSNFLQVICCTITDLKLHKNIPHQRKSIQQFYLLKLHIIGHITFILSLTLISLVNIEQIPKHLLILERLLSLTKEMLLLKTKKLQHDHIHDMQLFFSTFHPK